MKYIVSILLLLALAFAAREADLITETLPGCSKGDFNQYSGYFDVTDDKKYHYLLVESERSPSKDPVIFYFLGGPGCSSMNGYIAEHGPCSFLDDADLMPQDNPYSWNKFANVVYLESPVGVGYNNYHKIPSYDDEIVSQENMQATLEFFEAFPEFKSNDFYLSGVSYAGIYVPYLMLRIDEHNKDAKEKINLKGFLIGNAATNWKYDVTPAYLELAFAHGLINLDLHERIQSAVECDFADYGAEKQSAACEALLKEFEDEVANVHVYDIYRPPDEYYPEQETKNIENLLISDDKNS